MPSIENIHQKRKSYKEFGDPLQVRSRARGRADGVLGGSDDVRHEFWRINPIYIDHLLVVRATGDVR
jgi:hypothetical protein